MVVSISSSQGMPVDARQVVFGHLHNKSLTLSHCGRKCGYRNVVCEKMWFCRKIRVFFGQNHILFTKMNFEILQPLFCEIYSIVVMIMTQTTFKCEKMWLQGLPSSTKNFLYFLYGAPIIDSDL